MSLCFPVDICALGKWTHGVDVDHNRGWTPDMFQWHAELQPTDRSNVVDTLPHKDYGVKNCPQLYRKPVERSKRDEMFCVFLYWITCRWCVSVMLFAVNVHPDMKTVVVVELERLLYRPRVAAKAQLVLSYVWRAVYNFVSIRCGLWHGGANGRASHGFESWPGTIAQWP